MSKFEVRTFRKNDRFFSEYEHINYDKNTLLGKLWHKIGRTEKYKTTDMVCASDASFDFDEYINQYLYNKSNKQLVTVCLFHGKIVGIMFFEIDLECKIENKCYDLIILNPYLCYEKDIMNTSDVVKFIKESMNIVKPHYIPFYNELKKLTSSNNPSMYISLSRDQVQDFSDTIYNIYKEARFDDEQRLGMMFYTFIDNREEMYKEWRKEFKEKKKYKKEGSRRRSKSKRRSRSKSKRRSRSKSKSRK